MHPKLLVFYLIFLPIVFSSGQVTVPATTPVTVNPTPGSSPVTVPPGTNNPAGGQPVSTPVTSPATPAVAPPGSGGGNAAGGRKWCVAKSGVAPTKVQAALDYACGMGKADCSAIQQGSSCYNPNTLQNHASYAFNSYFQKNPAAQTSCDFGGVAVITTANPSTGSCVFPTSSSSSSSSPTTATPTPTGTPTSSAITPSGSGTGNAPGMMNGGSGAGLGGVLPTGIGESPANTTDSSAAGGLLRPSVGCIILVAAIVAEKMTNLDVFTRANPIN